MPLAIVLVLLLLAVPAPAAHAKPGKFEKSSGAVRATFTYDEHDDGIRFAGLRVTIVRNGVTVHDAPLGVASGEDGCEGYCRPTGLRVRDVNGDDEPEVLAEVYTGGAHCCSFATIFVWNPGTGSYRELLRDFGDSGFRITKDGAFVTGDDRFAYAFAGYAASPRPVRMLRLRGTGWRDVTRKEGRKRMARESRYLWRLWKRYRRDGSSAQGILAAWTANEVRLGRAAKAMRRVRVERRRGRTERRFPEQLKRRLKAWRYLR